MTDCVITAGVVISSRRWREVSEQGFRERENEAGKHSPSCLFNTCVSLDLEMRTFDFLLYEGTAHRRRFATGVVTVITFLSHLIFIKKNMLTLSRLLTMTSCLASLLFAQISRFHPTFNPPQTEAQCRLSCAPATLLWPYPTSATFENQGGDAVATFDPTNIITEAQGTAEVLITYPPNGLISTNT